MTGIAFTTNSAPPVITVASPVSATAEAAATTTTIDQPNVSVANTGSKFSTTATQALGSAAIANLFSRAVGLPEGSRCFSKIPQSTNPASLVLNTTSTHANGEDMQLSYQITFSNDPQAVITATLPSLTRPMTITLPKPLGDPAEWTEAQTKEIQDAFRALSIHDPILYGRFSSKKIELTDFQDKAVAAVDDAFKQGDKSIVVLPTGTGKTVTAWAAMDQLLEKLSAENKPKGKVFFIVDNTKILEEAEAKLHSQFPRKYTSSRMYGKNKDYSGDVIFATAKTLASKVEEIASDPDINISLAIFDEFHHLEASNPKKVLEAFEKKPSTEPIKFLGLSATPERADGINVFNLFGTGLSYELSLQTALERGFLPHLRIETRMPRLLEESSTIAANEIKTGDVVVNFNDILTAYKDAKAKEQANKSLTIVSKAKDAEALASFFRSQNVAAVSLTDTVPSYIQDKEKIKRYFDDHYNAWKTGQWAADSPFKKEPVPVMAIGVDKFSEGVDIPGIDSLFLARKVQSVPFLTQILGRGLRPAPHKTHLQVYDMVNQVATIEFMQYLSRIADDREKQKKKPFDDNDIDDQTGINVGGIELVGDNTERLRAFLNDVPAQLQRRYGNYDEITQHPEELDKLTKYFRDKLGTESADLKLSIQELLADPAGARERFLTLFNPMFINADRIDIHAITKIIFDHLDTFVEAENKNKLYQAIPELLDAMQLDVNHISRNLKVLRESLGLTEEALLSTLQTSLGSQITPGSLEHEFLFNNKYSSKELIILAEGRRELPSNLAGVDRTEKNSIRRFLARLYLAYKPELTSFIRLEDFGSRLSKFDRLLVNAGLLDTDTEIKLDLQELTLLTSQLHSALERADKPDGKLRPLTEILNDIKEILDSEHIRELALYNPSKPMRDSLSKLARILSDNANHQGSSGLINELISQVRSFKAPGLVLQSEIVNDKTFVLEHLDDKNTMQISLCKNRMNKEVLVTIQYGQDKAGNKYAEIKLEGALSEHTDAIAAIKNMLKTYVLNEDRIITLVQIKFRGEGTRDKDAYNSVITQIEEQIKEEVNFYILPTKDESINKEDFTFEPDTRVSDIQLPEDFKLTTNPGDLSATEMFIQGSYLKHYSDLRQTYTEQMERLTGGSAVTQRLRSALEVLLSSPKANTLWTSPNLPKLIKILEREENLTDSFIVFFSNMLNSIRPRLSKDYIKALEALIDSYYAKQETLSLEAKTKIFETFPQSRQIDPRSESPFGASNEKILQSKKDLLTELEQALTACPVEGVREEQAVTAIVYKNQNQDLLIPVSKIPKNKKKTALELKTTGNNGTVHADPRCEVFTTAQEKDPIGTRFVKISNFQNDFSNVSRCACCKDQTLTEILNGYKTKANQLGVEVVTKSSFDKDVY